MGLVPGTHSWLAAVRCYAVQTKDEEKVMLCDFLYSAWQELQETKGELTHVKTQLAEYTAVPEKRSTTASAALRDGIRSYFRKLWR